MPWTGKSFASKHNHSLSGPAAGKAASQANAMLRRGVPEGEAIATANKRAKHSPQSVEDHMGKRRASGHTLRGVASEFGSSKSTVQRKTARLSPLATGFTRLGGA